MRIVALSLNVLWLAAWFMGLRHLARGDAFDILVYCGIFTTLVINLYCIYKGKLHNA